jgi:cobalt-zinc-cadmium efflux system outer membrane protein
VAHQRAEREVQVARRALAATWGSAEPRFARVSGDLTDVRPLPSFEDLVRRLAQNPDLARWTAEMALRRAAVTLEKAKAIPDIAISGGMTHFEEDNSRTGILGLLVPLPIFDRNQGGILEARYKLAKSDQDRRAIEVRVGLELYRTYQSLAQAHGEAATLHEQALPAAQRAFDAAQEGYKQGKWGYLEVLDSQRTLFGVRAQWIDALSSYHKALAESERLIGQSLDSVAAPAVALN